MKKIFVIVCALALGISSSIASNADYKIKNHSRSGSEASSVNVTVPTGVFFDGKNFVKVEKGWLRISINGNSKEYDYTAQKDPYGNYVLIFNNGDGITMYPDGKSLIYNSTKYSQKSMY